MLAIFPVFYPPTNLSVSFRSYVCSGPINRLKQYRRIATRYEKRGVNYLAMLTIVATMLWL